MFLTFSNTILLIGLSAAVVPLILHLLSRSQYQSVEWGAMLFLEGLEPGQQYTARLNQFLLLAVRTSLVVFLAVALAQPVLQQWGPAPDARREAMRTANRGQLLCLAGAAICAAALAGLALAAASAARSQRRLGLFVSLLLAAGAGVGLVALTRRANAWQYELQRLLAQPSPQSAPTAAEGDARSQADAAILLDCSPSMNFEENGHTRFIIAQASAKQVLSGLHRGDRVSLVLLGRRQTDSELEPTADLQSVADRIDSARSGHDPADIARGLERAQRALDRDAHGARDLYIICDRQALSWRNVDEDFMTRRWPQLVRQSQAATRLFVIPVGSSDGDNVAVEQITMSNPPAIVGQPLETEVDLHNYGAAPRSAVPLTVSLNGREVFDAAVSIPANQVSRVSVPLRGDALASAGPHIVSAEIKTSGYRDDDRLDAIVDVVEPIHVLLISGDQGGTFGQFHGEADFIRLALSPLSVLHRGGSDPCKVDVLPADQWTGLELNRYQVVILADIERFSEAQARSIEQYVYGGGGLLIAPGGLSRIDSYNDALWRDGSGVLPAELQEATAADGSDVTAITGFDPASPVFQFLHDRSDLMMSSTIGRYFRAIPRGSDATTLAWYASGDPFLIEAHSGRGRVLLMTTSLDADWSTLPLSSFYLPFVQSAVRYLAAGALPASNLETGEPIQLTVEEPVEDRATIELPDRQQQSVSLLHSGGSAELRFTLTEEPGIYRVHLRIASAEKFFAFAVHPPSDESDLTVLSDKRWTELNAGLHLNRIDPNERSVTAAVVSSREGIELWPWGLAVVIALAVVELGLARTWSRDTYQA